MEGGRRRKGEGREGGGRERGREGGEGKVPLISPADFQVPSAILIGLSNPKQPPLMCLRPYMATQMYQQQWNAKEKKEEEKKEKKRERCTVATEMGVRRTVEAAATVTQ